MTTVAHGYQTKQIKKAIQKLVGRHNAQPVNSIASDLQMEPNLVNNVLYSMYKKGEVARTRNLDYNNVSQYTYYLESSSELAFNEVLEEWQERRKLLMGLIQVGTSIGNLVANDKQTEFLDSKEISSLLNVTQVLVDISKRLLEAETLASKQQLASKQ